MPYARVNNINLYYEVHGKGEPLVFINGWFMPLGLFYPLVPVFFLGDFQSIAKIVLCLFY